jgi:hypothetical protein
MFMAPSGKWMRAGKSYANEKQAEGWLDFVSNYHRGCPVKVEPFTFKLIDGKMTPEDEKILSDKFNMDPI